MSTPGLKKLTIENLRGSVKPFYIPFEKGKKLTIIYGENATGKSTICDAFEFLGKGRIGSLENRGLGKTNRYWYTIGKNPADINVTFETTNSSCCAKFGKSDVIVIPPELRPKVEILRRGQILSLIEATPGDRYNEIKRFIDVSGIETSEASLRQLIRELEDSREVAVARVQENLDSINQFWETAGKPGNNAQIWAEGETKRDANADDAEIKALGKLQAAYQRLTEYPSQLKKAEQSLQAAKDESESVLKKTDECAQTITKDASELFALLESARSYLIKHPSPSVCPLCESSDKVADLAQRINQRLNSFSNLKSVQNEKRTADLGVQKAEHQLELLRESVKTHVQEFEKARSAFSWSQDMKTPSSPAPEDINKLSGWLEDTAQLPVDWKNAETKKLDKKQFLATLKQALKTLKENVKSQKDLDILLPKLKRALKIIEEERRDFTDGILSAIADEVGRIYEAVHPGEGLNKISLELDPKKRASLNIGACFCEQSGTPPQAYFSDSHLDTLGLCIFLALASLDDHENTILVLDDILASVDEPHVERLIDVLYNETIKFRHCLITTHYRPWKEKLRWGWLKNNQCQFIELARWTNRDGMSLIRSIPDIERLRGLLKESPPDPQLVSAKSGVILEAALDFLTLLYECHVPRRTNGQYTLGDLLPSIDKKLRYALRVDVMIGKDSSGVPQYETKNLAPILDELHRIAQVRNVFGCHFNAISFELMEDDAIVFGQLVLELMDILTDPEAGWPRNSRSGMYLANSGETRRLHPLQRPH